MADKYYDDDFSKTKLLVTDNEQQKCLESW